MTFAFPKDRKHRSLLQTTSEQTYTLVRVYGQLLQKAILMKFSGACLFLAFACCSIPITICLPRIDPQVSSETLMKCIPWFLDIVH